MTLNCYYVKSWLEFIQTVTAIHSTKNEFYMYERRISESDSHLLIKSYKACFLINLFSKNLNDFFIWPKKPTNLEILSSQLCGSSFSNTNKFEINEIKVAGQIKLAR